MSTLSLAIPLLFALDRVGTDAALEKSLVAEEAACRFQSGLIANFVLNG